MLPDSFGRVSGARCGEDRVHGEIGCGPARYPREHRAATGRLSTRTSYASRCGSSQCTRGSSRGSPSRASSIPSVSVPAAARPRPSPCSGPRPAGAPGGRRAAAARWPRAEVRHQRPVDAQVAQQVGGVPPTLVATRRAQSTRTSARRCASTSANSSASNASTSLPAPGVSAAAYSRATTKSPVVKSKARQSTRRPPRPAGPAGRSRRSTAGIRQPSGSACRMTLSEGVGRKGSWRSTTTYDGSWTR